MTPANKQHILLSPGKIVAMLRLPGAITIIILLLSHLCIWGRNSLAPVFGSLSSMLMLMLAYFAGFFVHEWLHVVGYRWFGRAPRQKVGVSLHLFYAFAHCGVPVRASAYRASIALPGLVLGIVPVVIGITCGVAWLSVYGAFMTGGALGDARVLWALRSIPGDAQVAYRPEQGAYEVECQYSDA